MGFSLRDLWEQADFWDKEENARQKQAAQTRRTQTQKQPAQTTRQPLRMSGNNTQNLRNNGMTVISQPKPKQNPFDKFRDIFDANSAMDRYQRQQAGSPELYQDQQRARGVGERSINVNPAERAVGTLMGIARPVAQGVNTFGAMGEKALTVPFAVADITKESITGTDESYQRKLNAYNDYLRRGRLGETGGVLNMGTTLQNTDELNDPKRFAGSVLETGSDLASVIAPGMAWKTALAPGVKSAAPQIAKFSAANALDNTVANAGMQLRETGTVDPKALVLPAAMGAVMPVATYGAGRAVSKGVVQPTTSLVNKTVVNPLKDAKLIAPTRLKPEELADLSIGRQQMGTGQFIDEDVWFNYRRAAELAGVDYRDPKAVDEILQADRSYRMAKDARGEKIQGIKDTLRLNNTGSGMAGGPFGVAKDLADTAKAKKAPKTEGVAPKSAPIENTPTLQDALEGKSTKITSSSSSSNNALEPSASSPRNSGQGTGLQAQPTGRNQIKRVSNQESSQGLAYPNSTTKTREVNLNTGRLNPDNPNDLARISKETTETVNQLSNKDVQRIAKDSGIDTKTHTPEQIKQKIAEQLNLRQDIVRYMNEAEVARKAGDLDGAERSMLKAAELGRISRAQGTEAAQALQARKIIANELDTPQQRVFKLLDAAGVNPEAYVNRLRNVDFTDPKQVIDAYRDLVPAKKAEWLDTLRYNSMLSSPLTQAVNIFGNAQNVAIIAPIEKTLRGAIDAMAGAFGKERKFAAGEGFVYAKSAVTNIRNATRNFRDALSGTGKYANPDFQDYNIPLATKGASGKLYKGLSFPMRVLDGMDKFFRTMSEAGEDAALTLRESKGIKIKGNKSALMEEEAAYRVFQQELFKPGQGVLGDAFDSFASLVMSGRNSKNPVVSTISKFTVPFVKTINNINKQGMLEYSPLGVANMIGNEDKITALTRATMGTAVFGVSAMMLGAGDMTWAEPRDPEERARFRSEGKQPYSIKVGDKWVNFSKLTPALAFPMAMTAALDDAMNNKKLDQGNVDAILEAVSKYGNFLADQSYAKSVGDTLGAIGGDKEAVARMVSNNIQQVVPMRAFTGWVARMTDSLERKVDTSQGYIDQQVQMLMQQYPGLRQQTPTRDYKGEPIPANNQVFNAISPVRVTTDRGVDPLDAELDSVKAPEEDALLTKSQTNDINKLAQRRTTELQKQLMQSQDYMDMTPENRRKALAAVAKDVRAVEKKKYQAENLVGEYAQGYDGKGTTLTKKQKALAAGETPDYVFEGLPDNLNKSAKKLLVESEDQDDAWKQSKNTDTEVTKELQSWLPEGVKLPEFTNEAAKEWANLEKRIAEGKVSKFNIDTEKKSVLRTAFNSQLNPDERELYKLSEARLYDAIDKGMVTEENINKALAVEKQLYDAGLISKEGLAKKLGVSARGYKTSSRSRSSRSGGSKTKSLGMDYKLFGFGDPKNAGGQSLRKLLEKYLV